jgi:hypothetical protein
MIADIALIFLLLSEMVEFSFSTKAPLSASVMVSNLP